jgi:hypothetical protein
MAESTTVPVTMTPEAEARVAELGMRAELEQMLEHTRQTVPGLWRIEVTRTEPYDTGNEPGLMIEAYSDRPYVREDKIWWNWSTWFIATFPPQVCEHFVLTILHGTSHAG